MSVSIGSRGRRAVDHTRAAHVVATLPVGSMALSVYHTEPTRSGKTGAVGPNVRVSFHNPEFRRELLR
jgi:hypothetical protein